MINNEKYSVFLECRYQKRRGKGPDKYVAVQIVPNGVNALKVLNSSFAEKRGIIIKYFGEGYSNRTTSQSMLGKAFSDAKSFIEEFNNGKEYTPK